MWKVYEPIQWTVNAILGHHHSLSLSLQAVFCDFSIYKVIPAVTGKDQEKAQEINYKSQFS